MTSKRVLLTGASGFLGRHCLAPLLARGYEVHAAARGAIEGPSEVRWHQADLLDPGQITALMDATRPTHLLHCAWNVEPRTYLTSLEHLKWVSSSLRLGEEFARVGGFRMVGIGSCFEYDWRYGYCSEDVTPLIPATLYGTAKLSVGRLMQAYGSLSGLSVAWGRSFFLYGPHEDPSRLVSSVILRLLRDERAESSEGHQVRDYLHIADSAGAAVALLDSDVTGAVNMASGRPVAVREIVQNIARQMGREELLAIGALPTKPGEVPLLVADVTRLSTEVGWRPRFDLTAGLADTIAWWERELAMGRTPPADPAGVGNR